MNRQAFSNSLRAITGERRDYPAPPAEREPWRVAIDKLDELEAVLESAGYLHSFKDIHNLKPKDELQVRIEMRVNELRELITTGEIVCAST